MFERKRRGLESRSWIGSEEPPHPAPSPQVGQKMIRCSELASEEGPVGRHLHGREQCLPLVGPQFQIERGLGGRASQNSSHSEVC